MRERGIDVERFLSDSLLLFERHRRDGAHVVQPVCKLDDQDAKILRHGHEHLAHRGRLLLFTRIEPDALELGHAVDDRCNVGTEPLVDVGECDLGVFDSVMQQRSRDRHLVEPDLGDDLCNSQRMVDVRLAAPPQLRAVGFARHPVRPVDVVDWRLGVAATVRLEQRRQFTERSGRRLLTSPRQDSVDGSHCVSFLRVVQK